MATGTKVRFICPAGQWFRAQDKWQKIMAHAATVSVRQTGINARDAARRVVAASGLGPNWERSFVSSMHPKRGDVLNPWAWVHSKVNFAEVFEIGKTITPSAAKYLWIPTPSVPKYPGTGTSYAPVRQMNPKKYASMIGPLKFIRPPGKAPMLLGQIAGSVGSSGFVKKSQLPAVSRRLLLTRSRFSGRQLKKHVQWVPMFIGVESVSIMKRWGVRPAMVGQIAKLPEIYRKAITEYKVE